MIVSPYVVVGLFVVFASVRPFLFAQCTFYNYFASVYEVFLSFHLLICLTYMCFITQFCFHHIFSCKMKAMKHVMFIYIYHIPLFSSPRFSQPIWAPALFGISFSEFHFLKRIFFVYLFITTFIKYSTKFLWVNQKSSKPSALQHKIST